MTTVRSATRRTLAPPRGATAPSSLGAVLRRLDWDTEFFGALMGTVALVESGRQESATARADALARDLAVLLAQARAEGYAHLIFRAASDDLPAAWAAERAGFRLVDVGVDSTYALATTPRPDGPSLPIRGARGHDVPALRDLAAGAFVLSRFSADPFFSPDQVQAFHRAWITNLCNGLAQGVLVCELEGVLAGFVTCALTGDDGRIPLIATRAGYRRRGLGRALVGAALRWFDDAGARVVHVKTQAHNYPALALYHRAGFTVSKSELTFSVTLG